MRGIKIPQQDFALKMQGGLMREGGRICGRLRYSLVVGHSHFSSSIEDKPDGSTYVHKLSIQLFVIVVEG